MSKLLLEPGIVHEYTYLRELATFEAAVVEAVNPTMTERMREVWAGKVALAELLRPSKIKNNVNFYGSLTDITLEVMPEPYDRLNDARERGFQFGKDGPRGGLTDQSAIDSMIGFSFLAAAKSGGRLVGHVQAELWYRRASYNKARKLPGLARDESSKHRVSQQQNTHALGGMAVQRFVTWPKIVTADFKAADKRAKQSGSLTSNR